MSIESNREIIRRYFEEVWNEGDISVLDEIIDPGFINHTPSTPEPIVGPDDLKPVVIILRAAFPDLKFTIEDEIYDGDKAVVRCTMQGTHLGHLFGIPATGKSIKVNHIQIDRIVDDKITEHWRLTDELEMYRQVGAMKALKIESENPSNTSGFSAPTM
jgi:steroid delta-isomerase-like uncharacterized protein